jgi:ribose transport system ATP-binding protein
MSQALLLDGVHKHFGSLRALRGARLEVRAGEVHGLLGQNGSGKSTLVKVLTGFHAPDAIDAAVAWGEQLRFPMTHSREQGIAVIHQDLALVDEMTVAENVGVSTSYAHGALSPVSWRRQGRHAQELLAELGFQISGEAEVGSLSAADRAAVAVARAMTELRVGGREHQLLVLDEPTAYLPAAEAQRVIDLMRSVAARGSAVIFISHRLAEVMEVCDRVTILRDGATVAELGIAETSPSHMISLMLGRELGDFYPARSPEPAVDALLTVKDLTGQTLRDVTFALRRGEILGVTGLVGQGQSELPYLVAGAERDTAGTVALDGRVLPSASIAKRVRAGVVLVPANRKRDGVWLEATAAENISLPLLRTHMKGGLLSRKSEQRVAQHHMDRLGVHPPDPQRPVSSFSGGNQQKIVLAKWLQSRPRVLVLDEPTQGVDAGAKREILALINHNAAEGAGVLFCSSDHEEVAHVCHRVLVLVDGQISAELTGDDVNEHAILEACHAHAA